MNKRFKILDLGFKSLAIAISLLFVATPVWAATPHLELSPSSGTIGSSGTSIAVKIDTGGQAAKSAKAVISFDATKLEVASVTTGTFFDEVTNNVYNTTGQVVINANLSLGSSLETKTGTGTLATLNVKAKTTSGTATMTFNCTAGSSTDSGINDAVPTDIIDCTANIDGNYSLGTSSASASPSPSASGISSSPGVGGTNPSSLPVAGTTGPTTGLAIMALVLLLLPLPFFVITKEINHR
jgi:hypothetical protein